MRQDVLPDHLRMVPTKDEFRNAFKSGQGLSRREEKILNDAEGLFTRKMNLGQVHKDADGIPTLDRSLTVSALHLPQRLVQPFTNRLQAKGWDPELLNKDGWEAEKGEKVHRIRICETLK